MSRNWVVLLACTSAVTLAQPHVTVGEFPHGVFTTTISQTDISADVPAEAASAIIGTWELTFTDSGKFIGRINGEEKVREEYAPTATNVGFSKDSGEYACEGPGAYAWKIEEKNLVFTRGADGCAARTVVLTAHPLKLKA